MKRANSITTLFLKIGGVLLAQTPAEQFVSIENTHIFVRGAVRVIRTDEERVIAEIVYRVNSMDML